jgi:AcrR family transcriptional regulator
MPAPPKSPALRERYDARQRDVIDACARVFAERGYDGTSVDDLVAATGLARGGLYHYIGS